MFFGINCNNKWIANFLTGLTLMIFVFIFIQITFIIDLKENLFGSVMKNSCSIILASNLVSFLIIKLKSRKIFNLYNSLTEYEIKSFIGEANNLFSTIISIIISIIVSVIATVHPFLYKNSIFKEIFKQFEKN
jgi:hypothetical protein